MNIIFIVSGLIVLLFVFILLKKKIISISKDPSHYASNLPEVPIMKTLIQSPPIGFQSSPPIIVPYVKPTDDVNYITLKLGTGNEYVQKIGKDNILKLYNNIFIKPFYEKYLISSCANKKRLEFFKRKIQISEHSEEIFNFYKEMAYELSIDDDVSFNEWYKRVILLDNQLEVMVWIYLYLTKTLHIPSFLVNTFGNVCSFMTHKNLIGRNFDWLSEVYDNFPVYVVKNELYGITTIGFPGMIFSSLTAINKYGVWCSFNNASYSIGFDLIHNIPPCVTDIYFKLKEATNAKLLYNKLINMDYDISVIYFSGDNLGTYAVAQKPKVLTVSEFTPGDVLASRANKVLNALWYANKIAKPKAWGSDSLHRQTIMMKQLIDNKEELTETTFCHILQETENYGPTLYRKKGKNQDHTIYQCVYNSSTRTLYIRGNSPLTYNKKWYKLNI